LGRNRPKGKPQGKPRTVAKRRLARSARAEEVAKLAADSTQRQIAAKLGISQATVSNLTNEAIAQRWEDAGEVLSKLRSEKAALVMVQYDRLDDQEARLDAIEGEAHSAWKRSQQEAQKTRSEGRPATLDAKGKQLAGATSRVVVEREGQVGDPRYLSILRESAETRQRLAVRRAELVVRWCEIMGINRPRPWDEPDPPSAPGTEIQAGDTITLYIRGDGRLERTNGRPALTVGTNGRAGKVPTPDHE